MRKKIVSVSFAIIVALSFFTMGDSSVYASDDITGMKLEKEMRDLINRGIMEGYGAGEYRPDEQVSRGQFAAFIARALDLPEGTPKFKDVPHDSELADEIYRVSAAGIANGYDDHHFRMNDPITREQMAQIIDNSLEYIEVDRNEVPLHFNDTDHISPQFIQAVARNVYDGIIGGYPNGDFQPKQKATRAEAAAFISRMIQVSEKFHAESQEKPVPPVVETPAPAPPIVEASKPTPPPVVEKPKPAPPVVVDHSKHDTIMGKSVISAEKMAAFVKEKNPKAQDIDEIAKSFIEIGQKYGVRGDVAFAQSILETGWFTFEGSAVTPDQYNYGGLGVTSRGVKGNEFASIQEGVTAQIQHLYAYASKGNIPEGEIIVDLRFKLVSPRGKAPYWKDLSGTWAADRNYGTKILSLYEQLKNY